MHLSIHMLVLSDLAHILHRVPYAAAFFIPMLVVEMARAMIFYTTGHMDLQGATQQKRAAMGRKIQHFLRDMDAVMMMMEYHDEGGHSHTSVVDGGGVVDGGDGGGGTHESMCSRQERLGLVGTYKSILTSIADVHVHVPSNSKHHGSMVEVVDNKKVDRVLLGDILALPRRW